MLGRAQQGAEQLLAAAGLGDEQISSVVEKIVEAAQAATEASRGPAESGGASQIQAPPTGPSQPAGSPSLSVATPDEPPEAPAAEEPTDQDPA